MAEPAQQPGDDDFIREFFARHGGDFFIEVGVSHPTLGSPSWPLEQAGWTGVLVEPQPDIAAFLVTARKAKVFAVACSSPDRDGGSLALQVSRPPGSEAAAQADLDSTRPYLLVVPTRTLDSILREAEAPLPIDFLSLDLGGHEIPALHGLDLAHWQPQLIAIRSGHAGTHRHLRRAGYQFIRSNERADWYVPGELGFPVTLLDRWQVFRRFYLGWPLQWSLDTVRGMRAKLAHLYETWFG